MINEQSVQQDIDQMQNLIVLVETYETIAGTSVRRIRNSVLANRAFHVGLNRMFREITTAYKKEVEYIMRKKKIASDGMPSVMKHSKKMVLMLLSANTGLYGDLVSRTFTAFVTEVKRTQADVVIIGRMGKMFFEDVMPGNPFTYFDFPDNAIAIASLKEITAFLEQYERAVAFYAVFKNLLTQQVRASIVSGAELPGEKTEEEAPLFPYFFEPSLEQVTLFFENEIFASLLEQIFQESRLAKLAARMVLLDRAIINIETGLRHTTLEKQRVHHAKVNRELIDSLSGVALWN